MADLPSGQAKAEPPLGIYCHVPFCATACDYCAFYQTVPQGGAVARFLEGVAAEAALVERGGRKATTAFWGGGTPGLLKPPELLRLGETTLAVCGGLPTEWTVELAPATVHPNRVAALRDLGVTRVSLGAQSFQPALLDALGRQHTVAQIHRAFDLLRATGFASVNLDLMFALPGQEETDWRADLAEAVRLAPDHLSTYCLTFEEDTALWVKLTQGRMRQDTEQEAAFYERTWEFLEAAGYAQYEISNFARPGYQCLHNVNTWRMAEWIGLGPSAASQHADWRGANPPDLALWLEQVATGRRAWSDRVRLTPELLAADSIVFGLRMNAGVDLHDLQARFPGARWAGVTACLQELATQGTLVLTGDGRARLTPRGRLVADAVGAEVLEAFVGPAKAPA
jgi:oxygen-independent coproporphyrinogen-3 oxidase